MAIHPLDIQAGLYCRGDSSLGQCDLPDSLSNYYRSGRFTEIDLGFNHGVAIHDSDTTNAPLPGQILPENFLDLEMSYYFGEIIQVDNPPFLIFLIQVSII